MIWLTWRQFRTQAVSVLALVAAAAVVLALTGPRIADLARIDSNVFDHLTSADRNLFFAGVVVLALVPAVVGAFWGAPLVARELEAGTHRLVWTQSVTRSRWLATKLGVTALAAALAVGALTLAISWWAEPVDGALSSTHGSLPARITPVTFAMRGIAPVGYAVFALVLGVLMGAVLRRPLPAMAVTLALFAFVQVAVPLWVRPHLAPPVDRTVTFTEQDVDGITLIGDGRGVGALRLSLNTGGKGDWRLVNETVDAAGKPTRLPAWMNDCLPGPPPVGAAPQAQVTGKPHLGACFARLNQEGYRQHLVYQPASRFWRLQWTETALFLAASALLAGCCFWWTRNRLT